ncbi:MAG: RagB/SusD family nutrient uptake outer membrane protein [Gemmatimonadetes bacterium]|nr:RagB/SusD family nutrient uptake outer membrane protein [Gemmatimonadota bacterium]
MRSPGRSRSACAGHGTDHDHADTQHHPNHATPRHAPADGRAPRGAAVGCDKTLTVEPTTEVEESQAIIDAASARALAGAYDAPQSGSYYGGDFLFLSDLASDDVAHVGTFTTYADIDQHVTSADNSTLEGMWDAIYAGIGRANTLIAKVPNVTTLSEDERKDIVGQAHLLRALHYHNLVKLWGPVPIRLAPPSSLDELTGTERATVAQVYTQILTDINQAQQLISTDYRTREGSWLAAEALKTRPPVPGEQRVGHHRGKQRPRRRG